MDTKTARTRAAALVAQMSVEEAASQLRYNAPAIDRLGIPAYNWWNEALHGVARAGTATVFPQAIGLAAAFDEAGHREIAETIATEGRAKYNMQSAHGDRDIYKGLTFWSPNVNIFRDPRWGRGHETYGEDPYLTSRLGVQFVKGLQGDGKYMKAAACAKHFAVHSGPESIRHEFDAVVNQKDLRETYLPAFEALVKEAKVESVMGAYNRTNGEPCCGSKTLLKDILRGEWGFDGHIVSDCWAIKDFHMNHKVTDTAPESAALALKNGCDVNCGVTYLSLLEALQEGLVTEEEIREAAVRALATRFKLGLFDDDCEYDAIPYTACDSDEFAALAEAAAEKSMTLLKNDGTLPLDLDAIKTIAVIGPNADSRDALVGNYNGTFSRGSTFLEGIREYVKGKARVLYSQGCHLYKDRTSGLAMADDRLAEAVACAELSDAVILCVGLDGTLEGEEGDTGNEFSSGDKKNLQLPDSQKKLIKAVLATGKPVVTVLTVGSAIAIEDGNAILCTWYPGQAGGKALARVLFGEVSPSGRLPVTFYRSEADLPEFTDYAMKGRTYRYFEGEALYPFGYGLSYARFEYSDAAYADGKLCVTVKNVGSMAADEVAQVYVKPEDSQFAPPNASLCGFKRVSLAAGEAKRVEIALSERAFEVVNDQGQWVSGGKKFKLFVGGGQPDQRTETLTGEKAVEVGVEK